MLPTMRHSAEAASPKMSCLIQRSPLPTPPGLFSSADQAYGGSRPCARQTERLRPAALSRGSIAALRVRFERSNGSAARVVPHFENLSAHLNAEPKIQCSEITLSEHSGHGWTRCWLGPVANDPSLPFAALNCRTAKGSLDHLVGAAEQRGRSGEAISPEMPSD
jgi:hypothetical protein